MADGHHLDGVPLEQLMLVRVQSGLENARCDGRGRLVLSRVGSGREDSMNTFHFSLNGPVTNHVLGRFDSPVAIVASLARTCWDLGQKPAGLDGADTYFHADSRHEMTLAEATIIAPMGSPIPAGFGGRTIFYVPGADTRQTLAHRNKAISIELAERDVQEKQVAPVGWRDAERVSRPEEYRELGRALGCPNLQRRSHMNAPDDALERLHRTFQLAQKDFGQGDRYQQDDSGVDVPILDRCERLVGLMRREFKELRETVDCRRAAAFYAPKIREAEVALEGMRTVRDQELAQPITSETQRPPPLPELQTPPPLPSGGLMALGAQPGGFGLPVLPRGNPRAGREEIPPPVPRSSCAPSP